MSLPRSSVELGAPADQTSFSTAKALQAIGKQGGYRGIPEPEMTVESLHATVVALKELVELLTGQRGDVSQHAVKVGEMVKLGDTIVAYLEP